MLSYADSKKCNWNFMYTPKLIYVPNLSKFIKCLVLNYMPSFNCQARPQIQPQLKFKQIGARADTKFGFRPPHPTHTTPPQTFLYS